jgi:hypothetical protein
MTDELPDSGDEAFIREAWKQFAELMQTAIEMPRDTYEQYESRVVACMTAWNKWLSWLKSSPHASVRQLERNYRRHN